MGWPNQHRLLPALAFLAVTALPLHPALSETRAQTAPQTTAQTAAQNSPQNTPNAAAAGASESPALEQVPAQTLEVPQQSLPSAADMAKPATSEELGDAFMARRRYQEALEAYQKDLNRSGVVWNKMGIAYQLMFNQEAAKHCYQSSLRLDPKNGQVMNNLGTIYDAEKEYGDAERLYHKALKADPKSAIIYKNLGTNLMAQHRYKKGWEAYKTALALDPDIFRNTKSPRVQNPASVADRGAMNFYMAKGCMRAGMSDCAIDYLRMALNEGFTNPKKIEADSEFAGLKSLPAFQQLLASQRRQ
jgi:tetratricopeptide (TPR) repeat protein